MNPLLADMTSPALYIGWRYFSWWVLGASFVVAFATLCWGVRQPVWKSLLVAGVATAVMAASGGMVYIMVAMVWEMLTALVLIAFGSAPFTVLSWCSTLLFAALYGTVILIAVGDAFGVKRSKWLFWFPFLGNLLLARLVLATYPDLPISL